MNSRDIARSERDRSELIASHQPVEQWPVQKAPRIPRKRRPLPEGSGIFIGVALGLAIWCAVIGALQLLHYVK